MLAALDAVLGTQALETYLGQRGRIADDVVESDVVGIAIRSLIDQELSWSGSASTLLAKVKPENPSKEWPKNASVLGARITRLIPALRAIGVAVEYDRTGRKGARSYTFQKCEENTVSAVSVSEDGLGANRTASSPLTGAGTVDTNGVSNPNCCQHASEPKNAVADSADTADSVPLVRSLLCEEGEQ